MPRWYGTEIECSIDRETGVALSYVARFEGAATDSWTTTRFEPVPTIDPSVFAFTPPDGSAFRDPQEAAHAAMLRSAEEAGVDLSEVDTTDPQAVARAFMEHQHRGFFGPVPPAEQAEQYVPHGPPPDDPEAAEAAVRAAFDGMLTRNEDGSAVPTVEGGANLGPALFEAGEKAAAGENTAGIAVEHVRFLGPDEAAVWFTVLRDGHHQFGPLAGRARRIDGQWLVTRETFAQLVASVGVRCPPPSLPDVH
jgi:hypothetical protein